jgi:hypothetical protein
MTKFTPDAGRLERDSLLFAAGRASARPNRTWITLAAMLASTQVLSLALWLPGIFSGRDAGALAGNSPNLVSPSASSPSADLPDGASFWAARQSLQKSDLLDRPPSAETGTFIESEPPLHAFAPVPPSILN